MARVLAPAGTPVRFVDLWSMVPGLVFNRAVEERLEQAISSGGLGKTAIAFNSGRTGLLAILSSLAIDRPHATEVIAPAYTCFSVAAAIRRAGLRLRAVDLATDSFRFDKASLERALSTTTLAVIAVAPFGLALDHDWVVELANQHSIPVIEDAAQSIGTTVDGERLGTRTRIGLYSFSKGKPITGTRGGVVVTDDHNLAEKISGWRDHHASRRGGGLRAIVDAKAMWLLLAPSRYGLLRYLPGVRLGETVYNPEFATARIPGAAAALIVRMLSRLDRLTTDRAEIGNELRAALTELPLTPLTGDHPDDDRYLRLPVLARNENDRERIVTNLAHLGASRMYGQALIAIEDHQLFVDDQQSCPNAESLAARLFTLPTHPLVTAHDRQTIVRGLSDLTSETTESTVSIS